MKCRLQNILPTVSLPDTCLRWAALIVCTCIPLVLLNFRSQAPAFVFEENFDECEALIREIFPSYEPIFGSHALWRMPECDLAVVMAGSPRSGSTLLTKIIVDSVKRLSARFDVSYANLGYWRLDRHMLRPQQVDLANMTKMLTRIQAGTQVVILKTHEYDPEVLKLCRKVLVITSTTDVSKAMNSYVLAGWIPRTCDAARGMFYRQLKQHRCWQKHSRMRLVFKEFESDKRLTAISIMGKIVEMLNISTDAYLNSTGILFNFSSDYMHKEANPVIPGRRMKEDIKCKVEGSLVEEYSATYNRY